MRYGSQIRRSVQSLPPLQAERRLRRRMDRALENQLDGLIATGDGESELRARLGEYDLMLLDRLLESPTARPRRDR